MKIPSKLYGAIKPMALVRVALPIRTKTIHGIVMKPPCGRVHFTSLLVATGTASYTTSAASATSGRLSTPTARTSTWMAATFTRPTTAIAGAATQSAASPAQSHPQLWALLVVGNESTNGLWTKLISRVIISR